MPNKVLTECILLSLLLGLNNFMMTVVQAHR